MSLSLATAADVGLAALNVAQVLGLAWIGARQAQTRHELLGRRRSTDVEK